MGENDSRQHDHGRGGDDRPAVDVLVAGDHQAIVGLLGGLEAGLGDVHQELDRLVRELSMHLAAEEQLVYPRAEAEIVSAESLVELGLEDHRAIEEMLVHLDGADPASSRTRRRLGALQAIVREHFREEEEVLMPALRQALGTSEMVGLGDAFEHAKQVAATRPHPRLPKRPPGNILVGALEGLIDRARDLVEGRRRP